MKLSRNEREEVLIEVPGYDPIRVWWQHPVSRPGCLIVVDAPASVIIRRPDLPHGVARRLARERLEGGAT